MKGAEGLSSLAKQMLEMAGLQLTRKEKQMLWRMRLPATVGELEALVARVRDELRADAKNVPARERARLERLKKLNERADENERRRKAGPLREGLEQVGD